MPLPPNTRWCLSALAVALVACSHEWASFDPRLGPADGGVDGTTASSSSTSVGGAGAGATSSNVGSGASGGASTGSSGGGGSSAQCPAGDIAMVRVGSFCIDTTEVTRAAYAAWLANAPDPATQPAECAWNPSFVPIAGWPPAAAQESLPVIYIDWCDARAYCEGVGKRLCGRIGGGADAVADATDATKSEWYAACTQGGATAYPYGATYDPQACNGCDSGDPCGTGVGEALLPVGSAPTCRGTTAPYNALFDLCGNVWEWESGCNGSLGAKDPCLTRGGSYVSAADVVACAGLSNPLVTRDGLDNAGGDATYKIGVRCCAD